MNRKLDVVTFGEAMALFVATQPGPLERADTFVKRTAGAETNVAIGLSRLGLRVGWASRIGDDSIGRYALATMRGEGIDCDKVSSVAGQHSGFMLKGRVDDGSDPPIEYHRKGSAASQMDVDDVDAVWLRSARHLHATGVFAALSPSTLRAAHASIELMRAGGGTVSFDPNLRPSLWESTSAMRDQVNALARRAHWVMPGLEEGRLLTGQHSPEAIARHYRECGVELVVIKLGASGAYCHGPSGTSYVPGVRVDTVIDTVGAGDGFAVGMISALLEGQDPANAARRGAWIGALAVQTIGDTEGMPTRLQLQTWEDSFVAASDFQRVK
ncbi:MAG: sugar kinase [Caldimonas sp.]